MFVLMLIEFDEKDTGGMPGKLLPFREGTACGRTMKDPRLESTASKIDFQPSRLRRAAGWRPNLQGPAMPEHEPVEN